MTARDTGGGAKAALVDRYPNVPPRQALRTVFCEWEGNATAAAHFLSVGKKSLMAAVTSLGLDAWLAERWPNRARGGQGARLGR